MRSMSVDILGKSIVESPFRLGNGSGFPIKALSPVDKIRALDEALENARTSNMATTAPVQIAQLANPAIATDATAPVAQIRDVIAPNAATEQSRPGDAILSGLGRIQSVFAQQEAGLAATMESTNVSVGSMLQLQMNMVQYSVLIDVASKITGKLTQSVDSLVKGQ